MANQIELRSNDGKSSVKGELVLETLSHWQVAVGGKVSAFAKNEWRKDTLSSLLDGMFGFPTHR